MSPITIAAPIDTRNLAESRIVHVACGINHSLLVADDGTVYSFGGNMFGQAGRQIGGRNQSQAVATPIDVSNLAGRAFSQASGGLFHSVILADDGTAFSFGRYQESQLGRESNDDANSQLWARIAAPIDTSNLAGRRIKQVATGDYHNLLLADDGTVFSFGSNTDGQTGLNLNDGSMPLATSIDTTNLAGKSITQVAAGGFYSLLLADDGTVYSMGVRSLGAGQGPTNDVTTVATPIDATNLERKTIVRISAGFMHSLLLAEDGTVFAIGRDLDYGLSSGVDPSIATPIDLTNLAGRRVVDIAAGDFFSLLLTVPEPGTAILLLLVGVRFLTHRSRF